MLFRSNSFNTLPDTKWQHITFTMPDKFWELFWYNRHLMNIAPAKAADIIKKLARKKGCIPGIYLAIHTFSRKLTRNFHLHLSTTIGGLSLSKDAWIKNVFFHENPVKKMWRYEIITLLRKEFKKGKLKLPPHLKHIKPYNTFYSWTTQFYNKTWNVELSDISDDMKKNINYLGKYLKRPPIGETRIKSYNKKSVAFEYLDHYTGKMDTMELPALDFIGRLISHIPDKYFRNIRYYGFLSNRTRGEQLPMVYSLLNIINVAKTKIYTPWRNMIRNSFNYDPLKCPVCKSIMKLSQVVIPYSASLLSMHKEIANGYFKLL